MMMQRRQFVISPELVQRIAAIDVGTNSIRLIIAEPLADGTYRVLDDERENTRLGRNLGSTGKLDPEAAQRSLDTLRRMRQITEGYQVQMMRIIGTSALREASDGEEFCRKVREEIGLNIEVISSEEEAQLAFFGVARHFDLSNKNVAVADIGGGSTEIVLALGPLVEKTYATRLGAVRLSEAHGGGQTWTDEQFAELTRSIDTTLEKTLKKPVLWPHLLVGSGGTFTSLAAMIMAARGKQALPVRGYQVSRAEVRHLLDALRKMTPKVRRCVPGLSPERADIIVAGLSVIDRLMKYLKLNLLQVHAGGVRDGLLLTMVDRSLGPPTDDPHDRWAAAERFATACGTDLNHARHVARLAGQLHEQLAPHFGLEPADRPLLEIAALLQDVGYVINYDQHHKHSYQLILNSRLSGLRPGEIELIANLARYHRGARPKKKHEQFGQFLPAERKRIRKLVAILRLAGGFDRTHSQQVESVTVVVHPGRVELLAHSRQSPEVDLWGARRRTELFERYFEVPIDINWAGASTATNGTAAELTAPAAP
ncbi:MAG: Ppx/GppA family phosphatase [Pirellulales bacterium]|nr:Ppx/GppA family phosphatase [Pirellulales bacterium]